MSASALSPIQIARIALVRLSEKGVAPTPENYRRFYNDVAGITEAPASPQETPLSPALQNIAAAGHLVDSVTETTAGLISALEGHNNGLQSSIKNLNEQNASAQLVNLVGEILRTAVSMHQSVDASNGELRLMRDQLSEIRAEIAHNHELPEHDPLTGARNRYMLDGLMRHCVARARRYQHAFTVAMLDLDHFHHINEQFGNAVGDKMLAHIGNLARVTLRDSDVLVRYGGEEFLVLMPDTAAAGARFMMDRLKLVMQKTPLLHNGLRLQITISAGVAQLRAAESPHLMLERAQSALLAAKEAGRNTVVLGDSDT
jgi:diguanylate cyclase